MQSKPCHSESRPVVFLRIGKKGSTKVTRRDNLTYAVDDVLPLSKLIFLGLQQVMVISTYLVMLAIVVRCTTYYPCTIHWLHPNLGGHYFLPRNHCFPVTPAGLEHRSAYCLRVRSPSLRHPPFGT